MELTNLANIELNKTSLLQVVFRRQDGFDFVFLSEGLVPQTIDGCIVVADSIRFIGEEAHCSTIG